MPARDTTTTLSASPRRPTSFPGLFSGSVPLDAASDVELANTITHGIGLVLAVAASVFLLSDVAVRADFTTYAGCSLYAISLVSLYLASCLYHGTREPNRKAAMRVFDQVCIYFLIGGTATPVLLTVVPEPLGSRLLVAVWGIGAFGTILRLRYPTRFDSVSIFLYLLMGWIGASALDSFLPTVPPGVTALIVAGGVTYTLGIPFYLSESVFRWGHVVWHLFVLVASAMHFGAILLAIA